MDVPSPFPHLASLARDTDEVRRTVRRGSKTRVAIAARQEVERLVSPQHPSRRSSSRKRLRHHHG